MPNTPSPEAVDAAAEKVARDEIDDHYKRADDYFGDPKEAGYYVKAYCDSQTASLRKRVEELEALTAKAVNAANQMRQALLVCKNLDYLQEHNAIAKKVDESLALPTTKSDLLEEVIAALKFESEREDCFCDKVEMECVPCRAKRLLKRLTPQP